MKCPICNSKNINIEYKNVNDIEHRVAKGNFNYYKCLDCEAIFIYPMPKLEEISSFYGDSYQCHSTIKKKRKNKFKELIKRYLGFLFLDRSVEKNFYRIFKRIDKPIKNIKVLEYGCGNCSTLIILKDKFNLKTEQISGIDCSKNAIDICKQNGINAKHLCSIKDINDKFDIIYSFQVLEHLQNPKEFIEEGYSRLLDNGILYLQFPNSKSFGRKIFKKYWTGNDFPRHLYLFNKKTINILIDDKFEILYLKTDRFYSSSIKLREGLKLNENHWTDKAIWNILLRLHFGKLFGVFGLGDNIHLILRKKK